MKKKYYDFGDTFGLLYSIYKLRDIEILYGISNLPKQVYFIVLSTNLMGNIIENSDGSAKIFEDKKIIKSLNKYEWELFKPFERKVDYQYLLRTSYINDFILKNKNKIAIKYQITTRNWNRKLWNNLDFFIDEMNSFEIKDDFSFKIAPDSWNNQLLCNVTYNEILQKLEYRIRNL